MAKSNVTMAKSNDMSNNSPAKPSMHPAHVNMLFFELFSIVGIKTQSPNNFTAIPWRMQQRFLSLTIHFIAPNASPQVTFLHKSLGP
jgi:hypothetical protein